ncbi:MAG: DUF47 family protein [Candidatus Cloacimonadota bacterium]|nr:DUF47 family protein [Candidatus Cloacimonadota bacterium]
MKKMFMNRTKQLEGDIDEYLDKVTVSSLIFLEGIKSYLNQDTKRFETQYENITKLESEADNIRRNIKYKLYTNMLIPESRGDVLGLLETMDNVVDTAEKAIEQFSIEKPDIPKFLHKDFLLLAELSSKSVEEVVKGARSFFKEINLVNDFINKVHYYEHEADNVEEILKRNVFNSEEITRFSKKVHLRYFAEKIALVSDVAEEVAERLAVYAIKRQI